jgi:hypothetical protein
MMAAAIALATPTCAAWAQDNEGCTNATLTGEYAFAVTSYTPPGLPNGPPQVVAGIKTFDGKGNLTQRDYRGDSLRTTGQTDFSPEGQETGTYTVNSDCTGSAVINLNVPNTPLSPRRDTDRVCDQRRRQAYPRSRFKVHSAGIYDAPAHPN